MQSSLVDIANDEAKLRMNKSAGNPYRLFPFCRHKHFDDRVEAAQFGILLRPAHSDTFERTHQECEMQLLR